MDYYKCGECGCKISEFDMNYKASQEDKKILCDKCRENQNITRKGDKNA